jgi:hypothetical protein
LPAVPSEWRVSRGIRILSPAHRLFHQAGRFCVTVTISTFNQEATPRRYSITLAVTIDRYMIARTDSFAGNREPSRDSRMQPRAVLTGERVDNQTFDQFVRRLARTRLTRRTTVSSGSLGAATFLAAVGIVAPMRSAAGKVTGALATPSAQATPGADGTSLCKQPYALCSSAPCERPEPGATTTSCQCVVLDGYSIGFTSCEERAPKGNSLVSTFSTQNATSDSYRMTCPDAEIWANCLDMPCELDPDDPTAAVCQCQAEESGPYVTIGGDCDQATCSSVVWSAATLTLPVANIYLTEMANLGEVVISPAACPGATPMASPAASA